LKKRDYWLSNVMKKKRDMGVMEALLYKNQQELLQLQHRTQIFAKELLHVTQNLEYYVKIRVVSNCSKELLDSLDKGTKDMDNLIDSHRAFLDKVSYQCFQRAKQKDFQLMIDQILQISLDFRQFIKKHFKLSKDAEESKDEYFSGDNEAGEVPESVLRKDDPFFPEKT